MLDFRSEVRRRLLVAAVTLFGFVDCQLIQCLPDARSVYLTEADCIYMCDAQLVQNGYLLCKEDGRTVVPCPTVRSQPKPREADCVHLNCEALRTTECSRLPVVALKEVHFIRTNDSLSPKAPTYDHTVKPHAETKPNTRWSNGDFPRITFEEPTSQMYMYGILSFFFGVIAFFIFALVFRFLYKRYQRQPVHVHTFSGHQLSLGGLHLRSFLSPSAPQMAFPHNDPTERGIPGLDLPPSYVVASELLDPPPSYEDISKSKGHSAQNKVTSL